MENKAHALAAGAFVLLIGAMLVAMAFWFTRDPAVRHMLSLAIQACRKHGKYIGICGQGPSDHPDLAQWLLDQGIGSISLNPDTVVETWLMLAQRPAAR